MSITFLGANNCPTYIGLSTDIVSGSVIGTPLIGATLYTTNDAKWYIIIEASGSSYFAESYKTPALET